MLTHYKVIEHLHVDHLQHLLETGGDRLVGIGRLGHAGGMVVGQDDCGGVLAQDCLDHLTGVNTSRIDGAEEQLLVIEQAVLVVEQHDGEHFPLVLPHLEPKEVCCRFGLSEGMAQMPLSALQDGQCLIDDVIAQSRVIIVVMCHNSNLASFGYTSYLCQGVWLLLNPNGTGIRGAGAHIHL